MKNFFEDNFVFFISLLSIIWLIVTFWVFFPFSHVSETWSKGEIGDFIGGGLGGIAVLGVIFTIKIQMEQHKEQEEQDLMATTLRMYELLKPEIENLSVRIVRKLNLKLNLNDDDFDTMLKKFKETDRTVFLRAMQKHYVFSGNYGSTEDIDEVELNSALERFIKIMEYFTEKLENAPSNVQNGFTGAIKQTEVYKTYEKCFPSMIL
ncbi:hypothetical protein N9F42_01750 [Pseudomonadales bacterium]|nr:hypothetical protein [Pseudomonadales bacterium]